MNKLLGSIQSRLSLTTDIWSSEHSHVAYCCLTVHFIDESWEIQKRIIAFKKISYPHGGENLFDFMRESILMWNLDKIFLVVVDNATSNDSIISRLKHWLVSNELIGLKGALMHVRCSAHILNLVVQDGLSQIRGLLEKICETSKYLKRSPKADQTFETALNKCNLKGKRQVAMDVSNRWNSTYVLLETALPLQEAFLRLQRMDDNYKLNPFDSEWNAARVIHGCLRIFYDATIHFSGSKYPTSNLFFPDICKIHLKMNKWERSEHDFIRRMARSMKEKFDKYWKKCCLVLAIVVVLDPRFKMSTVRYYYTRIHGSSTDLYIKVVRNILTDLYRNYVGSFSSVGDIVVASSSIPEICSDDDDYERWAGDDHGLPTQKSEWDSYLDEPRDGANELDDDWSEDE